MSQHFESSSTTTPPIVDATHTATPKSLPPDWKAWHEEIGDRLAKSPYDKDGNLNNIYKSLNHKELGSASSDLKGVSGALPRAEVDNVGGEAKTLTFNPSENKSDAQFAADLHRESKFLAPYLPVDSAANAMIFGGKVAFARGLFAGGGFVGAELLAANALADNHRELAGYLKPSLVEASLVGVATAFGTGFRARAGFLIGAAAVGKGASVGLDYLGQWMDKSR